MGLSYGDLFAANFRAARARADLRIRDVAERMNSLGYTNWNDSKVSKVERNKTPVFVSELYALAVVLETTISDLVGGNCPPDALIEWPLDLLPVAGVQVRNSAYGYRDFSVTWHRDSPYPSITHPQGPTSLMATDKTFTMRQVPPSRLARTAGLVDAILADHAELRRPAS